LRSAARHSQAQRSRQLIGKTLSRTSLRLTRSKPQDYNSHSSGASMASRTSKKQTQPQARAAILAALAVTGSEGSVQRSIPESAGARSSGGNKARQGGGRHPCHGRIRATNQTSQTAEEFIQILCRVTSGQSGHRTPANARLWPGGRNRCCRVGSTHNLSCASPGLLVRGSGFSNPRERFPYIN
jgi:hypothetical protein